MPQACGNLTSFPKIVFQRSSDFENLVFVSLHYQLFETNLNREKTLSSLMGLKGGDYIIRKVELEIKQCDVRIHWERFMQIRKLDKFQLASRMN